MSTVHDWPVPPHQRVPLPSPSGGPDGHVSLQPPSPPAQPHPLLQYPPCLGHDHQAPADQQTSCLVLESIATSRKRPAPHGLLPVQDGPRRLTETGWPLEEGGLRMPLGALPKLSHKGGSLKSSSVLASLCAQGPTCSAVWVFPGSSSSLPTSPNIQALLQ